jgi:proliferating cell nuclear antigen
MSIFKAKLGNISALKAIVEVLSTIVDETVNFTASEKGFGTIAMDPSHVSMISLQIPKDSFEEFKCDKKVKIGVNLGNLNKILKRIAGNSKMDLELLEKGNKLSMKITNKTFTTNLVDLEEEGEYPEPKMNFNTKIKLGDPSKLSEAIKDAELFSDHITLTTENKTLELKASGDNGEFSTIWNAAKDEDLEIETSERSVGMYPISYISNIIKLVSVTSKLQFSYSTEMPILMVFSLKPDDKPIGIATYFLAPRVEEEGEEEEAEEVPKKETVSEEEEPEETAEETTKEKDKDSTKKAKKLAKKKDKPKKEPEKTTPAKAEPEEKVKEEPEEKAIEEDLLEGPGGED